MANDPRNPALEEAIWANPDDRDAYLVLADWLEGQDDPRASLIRLQTDRGARHTKPVRKLFAEHQKYLLGSLVSLNQHLVWQYGYVRGANVSGEHLPAVLAHPSCRFLVEVHSNVTASAHLSDLVPPRSLRRLRLWCKEPHQLPWSCETLVELELTGPFDITGFVAPNLTELTLRCRFGPLIHAPLPALHHLLLHDVHDAAAPLLARPELANLTQLSLRVPDIEAVVATLPATAFAAKLVNLDLGSSGLSTAGAQALLKSIAAFPALESLDVTGCDVDDDTLAALEEAVADVYSDHYDDAYE